jgi:hypothetical protein
MRLCTVEGCGKKHAAHGLCQYHYQKKHWRSGQYLQSPFTKGSSCSKDVVRRLKRILYRFPEGDRLEIVEFWRREITECEYQELKELSTVKPVQRGA